MRTFVFIKSTYQSYELGNTFVILLHILADIYRFTSYTHVLYLYRPTNHIYILVLHNGYAFSEHFQP
jgi:hypothetical protein